MSGFTGMPPPKKQDMFQVVVVDEAVAAHFPPGSKLVGARPHGASFWTRTARIDLELSDKTSYSLFMKVATGDVGLGMLRGEFNGASALHKVIGDGIPRPVGWGTYKSDPNSHFYLCDFVDMIDELPDIRRFCQMLAKLHHDSMALPEAPEEFGFHVVTYEGTMYQDVTWCKKWEDSFLLHLQAFIDQERKSQGPSRQMDELIPPFLEKVVPRLLRPLQTHGRSIKPVLVHGDIWYGNMATSADTGEPLMFDPSVFWGHNECELEPFMISAWQARLIVE
ncbi:hypothetical protein CONLIGDRAFT_665025, partial [Coniochaeta ligniaria NRRL 30616]